MPPKAPALPKKTAPTPFWKRIPRWLYWFVVLFATVITLAEGYPWLSIQRGEMIDPLNPYSEAFDVSNGGYIPITNIGVICGLNFTDSRGNKFNNFLVKFPQFADYLEHNGTATVPCFRSVAANNWPLESGAELTVTISYAFYHANLPFLRRSQTFRFKSIVDKSGLHHWLYLS
jgi:hypothetical protein